MVFNSCLNSDIRTGVFSWWKHSLYLYHLLNILISSILGGSMSDAADDLAEVLGATFTLQDGHAF